MTKPNIFDELFAYLAELRDEMEPSGDSTREVCRLIRSIAKADLTAVLEDAISVIRNSQIPRGSSLVHENGFQKISLYKVPTSQIQVRLNIWPAGSADTSIHDHRWHFASAVLSGAINHRIFEVLPDDAGSADLIELFDADENLVKAEGTRQRVACRLLNVTEIHTGATYAVAADEHHQVDTDVGALTLMIAGAPSRPSTRVIRVSPTSRKGRIRLSPGDCIHSISNTLTQARPGVVR